MPLDFVSYDCWGSLLLNPGLEPPAADKIGISPVTEVVLCVEGGRGEMLEFRGFRAKNPGSNLSSIT